MIYGCMQTVWAEFKKKRLAKNTLQHFFKALFLFPKELKELIFLGSIKYPGIKQNV